MKLEQQRRTTDTDRREAATTPAAKRAWTKPDFTEVVVCAEIGAYAFRAG